MTEQLTGYEASSVAEIGAILDSSPATADDVYLETMNYSERAIAAVAAKRAGGGGSLPSQWTVDPDTGSLQIAAPPSSFEGENGFGGLILKSTDDDNTFDVFAVQSSDGSSTLGIDPFGYIDASGMSLSATGDYRVLQVVGLPHSAMTHDYFEVVAESDGPMLRLTAEGNVLMPNLPTSDPAVAGALYNDAGTLKISAG